MNTAAQLRLCIMGKKDHNALNNQYEQPKLKVKTQKRPGYSLVCVNLSARSLVF